MDALSLESEVKIYCRNVPSVFVRAKNAVLYDEEGQAHIDLLSACGALNYGHNHPKLIDSLLQYIAGGGVSAAMDLNTTVKRDFLCELEQTILQPRGLAYKVQFTGPTGTNAVEAALKLARKVTHRQNVVAFSNAFHGMTLGALSVTGNALARKGAGLPLGGVVRLPFDDHTTVSLSALETYARMVESASGGLEAPAAFVLEAVQGEGGLNVASPAWLEAVQATARRLGALVILDDVQAGCGRTGTFFSFEGKPFDPDIVCLAKSIGGVGLPLALVLIKPRFDLWEPGEHTGTFRANGMALAAATAALELWRDTTFVQAIAERADLLTAWITRICRSYPRITRAKGIGLMQGIEFASSMLASAVVRNAVGRQLVLESCGPYDEVVKVMPPLTIEVDLLREALDRLEDAIAQAVDETCQQVRLAAE